MINFQPWQRTLQDRLLGYYCRLVVGFLVALVMIVLSGLIYFSAGIFWVSEIRIPVHLPARVSAPDDVYQAALVAGSERLMPRAQTLGGKGASWRLRTYLSNNPQLAGTVAEVWLPAAPDQLDPAQTQELRAAGRLRKNFSLHFLLNDDSRSPLLAGVRGALVGSLLVILISTLFAVPVGCAGAIYLAEFAPRGKISNILEILVNNLAVVPSIVYGLLGFTILIGLFNLPRASALVAGLILGVMILPIIVVSSKLAIKNVPSTLREAALSLGASHMQAVFHHVLPAALPGILSGISIALIRALGETAPLLMIGMSGFISSSPTSFADASPALPIQIYTWATSPEPAFMKLAAGAVLVLIALSVLIHLLLMWLTGKFARQK